MRRINCLLCLALSTVAAACYADEPKTEKSNVVMAKKLEYSQDMLRALMNDDLARLERDVKLMQVFTRLEEMYRAKDEAYDGQLKKFESSISALSKSVAARDKEAASQAYVDMVQSCIRCHRHIRGE